jgi:hypothetical protein
MSTYMPASKKDLDKTATKQKIGAALTVLAHRKRAVYVAIVC